MSNRKPHMEEWLRQAASQAPEITPEHVKQQAWNQLSNMLDKSDDMLPLPYFRGTAWWVIVLEIMILVGAFTLIYTQPKTVVFPSEVKKNDSINIHQQEIRSSSSHQQTENVVPFYLDSFQQRRHAVGVNLLGSVDRLRLKGALAGSADHSMLNVSGNALAGSADQSRSNVSENALPSSVDKSNLNVAENAIQNATDKTKSIVAEKALPGSANQSRLENSLPNNTPGSTGKKNSQQQNSTSSTSATYRNINPSEKNTSRQQKNRFPNYSSVAADDAKSVGRKQLPSLQIPETREVMLRLNTKQLFIPVTDSGLTSIPAPKAMHPKEKYSRTNASGFSLRIAALIPIAEAYGAGVNIEYAFKWRNKWRVRPYAGAEYLTGFNKTYDHRYYGLSDIPGGPIGWWRTDSIVTHFTLFALLYGKAGVQAAYTLKKWEASTGIEYRYLLQSSGKDTFARSSNTIPFQPDLQPVKFNKKQVTGSGNLRIQLGLDYWIRPRLQIGAIYYIQLKPRKADSTYQQPNIKLPDQTSLQVHARYFLRKNK